MSNRPLLIVQENPRELISAPGGENNEIIAIAVYNKEQQVPPYVTTQRMFDGEEKFPFPSQITLGATKTRIVYSYSVNRWHELLSSLTLPSTPNGLKALMIPLLIYLQRELPLYFGQITYDREFSPDNYAELITMA